MIPENTSGFKILVGTDLVYIPRVAQLVAKFPDRFINKILTEPERTYCLRGGSLNIGAVAKRFATKEAFSKLLGCGIGQNFGFKDVWVENAVDPHHKPALKISPRCAHYLADVLQLKLINFDFSLTDDNDYALAHIVGLFQSQTEAGPD